RLHLARPLVLQHRRCPSVPGRDWSVFPQPLRLLLVRLGRLVSLRQQTYVLGLDDLTTLAWYGELVDPAGGRHGRTARVVRGISVELAHRGPRLPDVLVHPGPELLAEPEGPGHRTLLGAHVRNDLHGPVREPALVRAPVPVSHGVLLSRYLSLSLTRAIGREGDGPRGAPQNRHRVPGGTNRSRQARVAPGR